MAATGAGAILSPAYRHRHSALVRVTHWITAVCFAALLVSGVQLVISHPRFYWGETGNVNEEPLFRIPIPSSRATVPTGYNYVLPDQNGWSRSLHFQTAWLLAFAGAAYGISGLLTGHFRKNLLPRPAEFSRRPLLAALARHARLERPPPSEAWSYNLVQRLAYVGVVFLLFPLMIWTGLAMSPAVVSAAPVLVTALGGHQSARTIHFFAFLALALFSLVHVAMVIHAGFLTRMRAMITGRLPVPPEAP